MAERRKIGILVERARAYGRGLCEGIASRAHLYGDWALEFIDGDSLRRAKHLKSFDGFVARVIDDRTGNALARTGRPVVDVFFDRRRPGFAVVESDHAQIGSLAAEHFMSRRFTNFAFCGYGGGYSLARFSGFRDRLLMAGFDVSPFTTGSRYVFDETAVITERVGRVDDEAKLLRWVRGLPKPVGVFCAHDYRAWQLLKICMDAEIGVPGDVAILGVDNDLILCGFSTPMLSSIDPDSFAIGEAAAETLRSMLASEAVASSPPMVTVPPRGVVVRESTETYPIRPAWISDALVYIGRHAVDGITASDVFAHIGLSHTIVDRAFRETLGTTVQKTIQRTRLESAVKLLRDTSLPISEIASRTGFSSPIYFNLAFKKRFGHPPSSLR